MDIPTVTESGSGLCCCFCYNTSVSVMSFQHYWFPLSVEDFEVIKDSIVQPQQWINSSKTCLASAGKQQIVWTANLSPSVAKSALVKLKGLELKWWWWWWVDA